jgi:alpha-L-fucosidase
MNIGPRSDGTIPEQVQQVLLDVGAWLNINGEAIYGTRPWRMYGEGPTKVQAGSFHDTDVTKYTPEDFRFTAKGDVLYVIGLAWPVNGEAAARSLAAAVGSEPVASVALLGGDPSLRFEQKADGLHVYLPSSPPAKYAYVLRVTFQHAAR